MSEQRRILFLCTGNYYRSRFAEELFNHLAAERGLNWRADSCGLHVQADGVVNHGPLSQWAREGLGARGLVAAGAARFPRQVCEAELAGADLVIAVKEAEHRAMMQAQFPAWENKVRYWAVDDLDCALPADALAILEGLVGELVEELAAGGRSASAG